MFKVCKNSHDQIMHHVMTSQSEHGGNFNVSEQNNLLVIDKTHTNHKSHSVAVKCSRVEWHTHPKKCIKDVCALALPSSDDIQICLSRGLQKKCEVHFVYTYIGVFVIYCIESAKRVKLDPYQCGNEINNYWKNHKSDFENNRLKIEDYSVKWLSKMKELGFVIDFFNSSQHPTCKLTNEY